VCLDSRLQCLLSWLFAHSPKWTKETGKEELERQERDAFLTWRKEMAQYATAAAFNVFLARCADRRCCCRREETSIGLEITPFEKNLEIWRQLYVLPAASAASADSM
jgi:large subunit GTPase 1